MASKRIVMASLVLCVASAFVFAFGAGEAHAARKARADLAAKSGSRVSGTVTFEERGGGVLVRVEAKGVPAGKHGFHIHAKGDCSSADGTSAGGHYNPMGRKHGGPDAPPSAHHAGDLGNVTADASGDVRFERMFSGITIGPGPASIAGRGVILHAGADDLKSQPTGAAGGRLACGVIGIVGD